MISSINSFDSTNTNSKSTQCKKSKGPGQPPIEQLENFFKKNSEEERVKAEGFWACIMRIYMSLIVNAETGKGHKKVRYFKDYLRELENSPTKFQLFEDLRGKRQNKTYNSSEIKDILKSSYEVRISFISFIQTLLNKSENDKCSLLNLKAWPKDGNCNLWSFIFDLEIYKHVMDHFQIKEKPIFIPATYSSREMSDATGLIFERDIRKNVMDSFERKKPFSIAAIDSYSFISGEIIDFYGPPVNYEEMSNGLESCILDEDLYYKVMNPFGMMKKPISIAASDVSEEITDQDLCNPVNCDEVPVDSDSFFAE
mmetsp:Transcript_6941/g.12633  ORF Transcript_6941/g.12633 Transcript_6941/m.12633 type:complete len:312 (+) Transcript_6941:134-1069(+)